MSCYELTLRMTMCYRNFITLRFVAFSIFMIYFYTFFRICFTLLKNNSLLSLLLNICKLSYFIGYRYCNPSPLSFKYSSFLYPLLEPNLTTHHSNIGVRLRQVTKFKHVYIIDERSACLLLVHTLSIHNDCWLMILHYAPFMSSCVYCRQIAN